jgi:beta-lactamase regulating signal transducer with metallopeptidase domain
VNTLGIALIWCVAQVTLIGLLVSVLYLAARWLRPAAAGPILLTGLVTIVALSLLSLSPWPRWSLARLLPSGASVAPRDSGLTATALAEPSEEHVPAGPPPRPTIVEEMGRPQTTGSISLGSWPTILARCLLAVAVCRFAWLVLGVLAVQQQLKKSRPIEDRELAELIDVLCAELDCLRRIEVRQSDSLVTAATIGWRRPVLLLPPDWKTWSEAERRAVLAHEIAHARGQDCLAALWGQLALMLHAYHPLLHWMADRLRLEQELTADAAAAGISGGHRQYLVTIAELALRQHERPILWPARTFLPTRTTFLRRIAMLRDGKLPGERLSPVARFLSVGLVLLGGLLVAGLRGPAQPATARADEPKTAASSGQVLRAFTTADKIITKDDIQVDDGAWRIEAKQTRTIRLFEIPDPGVEKCLLFYRAKLKTENVEGRAYLEMWCRFPAGGEYFSRGLMNPVSGTTDWASYETPFFLKAGERPDLVKLNLIVEGKGTVWIKDVQLVKGPLPKQPPTLTQTMVEDVQPDGTIRFTNPDVLRNGGERDMTVYQFRNSDFVKLEKITDASGKSVAFETEHVGKHFRYRVPLDPPLAPGKEIELICEGTQASLIRPGDEPNTFEYHMKHFPAAQVDVKRIEVHRLPAGAELLSKSPADLIESRKDGRIELRIERLIPPGGSLEVSYRYRLKLAKD